MQTAKQKKFSQWHKIANGLVHLSKRYGEASVNAACKRAIHYNVISYISIKQILENDLHKSFLENKSSLSLGGFSSDLQIYDKLVLGGENNE